MIVLVAFILLGVSGFALVYTYLLYPRLLQYLVRKPIYTARVWKDSTEDWPQVAILMSAYNEIKVIEEKLNALLAEDYPGALHIYIGSDCSSDGTNECVAAYAAKHPNIHFYPYTQRRGKPGVINELARTAEQAGATVFLITDANVMPTPSATRNLVRHFANPRIAVVDSHMRHTGMQDSGISEAENTYISNEVRIKHHEGLFGGCMVGPFGGFYAVRSRFFQPVPANFLVDDFYITLKAIEQGGMAINDLDAVCFEDVSHDIGIEFRRKTRISAGNFQNMYTFRHLWWPPFTRLAWVFISHKIMRWLGPFWLLGLFLGFSLLVFSTNTGLEWLIGGGVSVLGVGVLDKLLSDRGILILPLRGMRYFLLMNIALLKGFFRYLNGIKSNVWEPTKRNNGADNAS